MKHFIVLNEPSLNDRREGCYVVAVIFPYNAMDVQHKIKSDLPPSSFK